MKIEFKTLPGNITVTEQSTGDQPGKRRISEKTLSLLVDFLSVILFATGVSIALFTATALDTNLWICLSMVVGSCLLIALFRLRWWVGPVTVLSSLIITGAYTCASGKVDDWGGEAIRFMSWALNLAPYHPVYSENGSLYIVQGALIFLISVIIFIIVRKLFFFPLAFVLFGGVVTVFYIIGYTDLAVSLCFVVAGLIVTLPRMFNAYANKGQPSEKVLGRGPMQIVALPIAILSVVLAMWITPEDATVWRSNFLINQINDIGYLLSGPLGNRPIRGAGFGISGEGYMPLAGRLGGPVELSDRKVFSVSTDTRPVLMKGSVDDYYFGFAWGDSRYDGEFRFESLFWRGYRAQSFNLDRPLGGREEKELFAKITRDATYRLDYSSRDYTAIFYDGMVRKIEFRNIRTNPNAMFDLQSELFLQERLRYWQEVNMTVTVIDRHLSGFDENIVQLERLLADDYDKRYDEYLERYTQLPETLPQSVYDLTQSIVGGIESPYLKARAIETWLGENCKYTLTPVVPPEDMDFVAHFLETREGYCTYYASAMTVMARAAGLPARYVTGFGLKRGSSTGGYYIATGKTAHAWSEVYLSGIGWVDFDPLKWNSDELYWPDEEPDEVGPVGPITPPIEEDAENVPDGRDEPDVVQKKEPDIFIPFYILFALIALYFIAKNVIQYMMAAPLRQFALSRVVKKNPTMHDRMERYYRDMLIQLRLLDLEPETGDTFIMLAQKVDARIKIAGMSMSEVADLEMKWHYAGIEPTMEDISRMQLRHDDIEHLIREALGGIKYFWRRIIRNG